MGTIASQIISLTIVYPTVYSDADQRKHQSSASLAFVWGIHRDRWIPRTKGQLRGKMFPFDDVIMRFIRPVQFFAFWIVNSMTWSQWQLIYQHGICKFINLRFIITWFLDQTIRLPCFAVPELFWVNFVKITTADVLSISMAAMISEIVLKVIVISNHASPIDHSVRFLWTTLIMAICSLERKQ